jgi:hypothetical protein
MRPIEEREHGRVRLGAGEKSWMGGDGWLVRQGDGWREVTVEANVGKDGSGLDALKIARQAIDDVIKKYENRKAGGG